MKQYQATRIAAKASQNAGGAQQANAANNNNNNNNNGQNGKKNGGGKGQPQQPAAAQPELKPPEVINTIQEVAPKAGPAPKPPKKLASGGNFCAISEELISLSDQFEHFHSNVDR
eukprot:9578563-Karenia_brevis.AAC.1